MLRILGRVGLVLVLLVGMLAAADYLLPGPMAGYAFQLQRGVAGLTEKRASIPGFEMPYLEGGSGEPLVLVHGFGADKDNFDRVAIELTKHYRVVAPDLPGFGDASRPAGASYTIAEQVERLGQFMDAIGLAQAHLGGNSMGGWIVASFAAAHPARSQSLWLLAPAGVQGAEESDVRRSYRERGEALLMAQNAAEYERILDTVFFDRPFFPYSVRSVLARQAAERYAHNGAIFKTLNETWETQALEPRVRDLPVPTLIVWGDRDRALHHSGAAILHGLMPRSQVVIMPDVGHLPHIEAWRQSAADYLRFRATLHQT